MLDETGASHEVPVTGDPSSGEAPGAPVGPKEGDFEGEATSGESGAPGNPPQGTTAEAPEGDSPGTAGGEGAEESAPRTAVLQGTPVSPGLGLGPVHLKEYDLARAGGQRIAREDIERELNRFHRALTEARDQLKGLKDRLAGRVPAGDARILDTHVTYLKDSVFISDVENLILNEQLSLEASIAKVITDFDRIFRLVPNETLRERAVDLRDVSIRVLRFLEKEAGEQGGQSPPRDYVLVARELSIVDMFNLEGDRVLGILTEEGGLTSHAAILARSMRIPTITAVDGLLEAVEEGDFVILDASEGIVRVNPDEQVRAQFHQEWRAVGVRANQTGPATFESGPATLGNGDRIELRATCGNLPEVEQAAELGCSSVGLYRTELMFLVEKVPPTCESLHGHYASVLRAAGAASVTFRLLDADSSMGLPYLHEGREPNPSLGRAGIRALLGAEGILRLQLQALLLACEGVDAPGRDLDPLPECRIAIPFVTDCTELWRVLDVLAQERAELTKQGRLGTPRLTVGSVLETPASFLSIRELAKESEFLLVGLDSVIQHLLAVDRGHTELAERFADLHPVVLRAMGKVIAVAQELDTPLSVFGVTAARPNNLAHLIGLGLRDLCIPPVDLSAVLQALPDLDPDALTTEVDRVRAAPPTGAAAPFVEAYRRSMGHDGTDA